LSKTLKWEKIQIFGIFLFILGIFLLFASFKAKVFWYVFILGIFLSLKGLFWLLKPQFVQKIVNKWVGASEYIYKLWGLVVYTIGIFLLIWGG